MAPLKFIPFIFAFSLFFQSSHAAAASQPAGTVSAGEMASVDCLNDFNAPRILAGMALFTEKSGMGGQTLETLCERVQEGTGGYHQTGTYFYAHQTGEEQDCAAAVAYWRGGLAAVKNQLPPEYTNKAEIYKNEQFLGLVGLFNPKENATLECQYIKCPVTSTTTPKPSTSNAQTSTPEEVPPKVEQETVVQTPQGAEAGVSGEQGSTQPQQKTRASVQPSTGVLDESKSTSVASATPGAPATTPASMSASPSEAPAPPQGSELQLKSQAAQESAQAESGARSASGVSAGPSLEAKPEAPASSPCLAEKTRRLEATKGTYNALVCMTTPTVLVENEKPFTQDQWDKILGATSASSTATVSAFSLLALTALAIYMI